MRNAKRIIGVAVPAAVIAVLGADRVFEMPKSQVSIRTKSVVVALSDIPEGRAIERRSLVVNQYPIGTIPDGAYASIDSVIGRVAMINIYKGEAIVPGRLAPITSR